MLVVLDPDSEWADGGSLLARIGEWTRQRGNSPRLYPGSLVWCVRQPGTQLRDKVELMLAWQLVAKELAAGVLGAEYDRAERAEVQASARAAKEAAEEEVWASYRFVALHDSEQSEGIKVIDLGAGHSSASETLAGRVIAALKAEALLNESVGAGYLERHWPPAFKASGAWPLTSLRQSFLDGSLTRLGDPDAVLRRQIVEFVARGDLALGSGRRADGGFERLWHREPMQPEEVAFEKDVFLVAKATAEHLTAPPASSSEATNTEPTPAPTPPAPPVTPGETGNAPTMAVEGVATLRLNGTIPAEVWNRFGTKVLPKLRSGQDLRIAVDLSTNVDAKAVASAIAELRQALDDLEIGDSVAIQPVEGAREG